ASLDRTVPADRGGGAPVGPGADPGNDRAAAAAHGVRDSGRRTLPAHDGGGERHARRALLRLGRRTHRAPPRGVDRTHPLSARRDESLSRTALGRTAPAGRPDAGADARTRAALPR